MSKILNAIFAKATRSILAAVFMRPEGIHLRALMALTGLGSASAQRELGNLTGAGLLVKEEVGKVLLYKANKASPIYAELAAIFRKTDGVAQTVTDVIMPFRDQIERAFIYGSVARNEDTAGSDIDLFLISTRIGSAELYPGLVAAEVELGRKISLNVYRPAEFQRKLADKNHFLLTVMDGPKIELIRSV